MAARIEQERHSAKLEVLCDLYQTFMTALMATPEGSEARARRGHLLVELERKIGRTLHSHGWSSYTTGGYRYVRMGAAGIQAKNLHPTPYRRARRPA